MREDTKKFLKELFSGGYRASTIGFVPGLLHPHRRSASGYWLSTVFDSIIFIIIGLIVGIIAGFRQVYLMGKKFQDK